MIIREEIGIEPEEAIQQNWFLVFVCLFVTRIHYVSLQMSILTCRNDSRENPALSIFDASFWFFVVVLFKNCHTTGPRTWISMISIITRPVSNKDTIVVIAVYLETKSSNTCFVSWMLIVVLHLMILAVVFVVYLVHCWKMCHFGVLIKIALSGFKKILSTTPLKTMLSS